MEIGKENMGQLISLAECYELARWDNKEQADEMARDLAYQFGGSWSTYRHHNHYHIVGCGENGETGD